MKKLILISLLFISLHCFSQIGWENYSTSFSNYSNKPSLGVAIPYNGIYNNFNKNVVGISYWNPGYQLNIDTTLDAKIPLYFVYDTTGIYFLAPYINEKNKSDFEITVLLNNKLPLIPWSCFKNFTLQEIGNMKVGSGISGSFKAQKGEYIVAHLRNKNKKIISSVVIYFRKAVPKVESINTSDNAASFSELMNTGNDFGKQIPEIGWHRQYSNASLERKDTLSLSANEKNILIALDALVYKRDALEYILQKDGKVKRDWGSNEYDSKYILLKNLSPGKYTLRIRYKRQRESTIELNFIIPDIWYKTAAFKAAIVAFIIMLTTALYFLFKYLEQEKTIISSNKKAEEADEKLQSIHARLNPHFTFNALGSIQGLMNKGDIEMASKYLSSFGALLREIINDCKFDQIPLQKELDILAKYISLEQLGNHFEYNCKIDGDIDINATTVPPFILQPFVENAIRHGLCGKHKGVLTLSITKEADVMKIKIADDGNGFDTTSMKEGNGISLSKRRIALLNNGYGEELIQLNIESTQRGSLILISFKNWV